MALRFCFILVSAGVFMSSNHVASAHSAVMADHSSQWPVGEHMQLQTAEEALPWHEQGIIEWEVPAKEVWGSDSFEGTGDFSFLQEYARVRTMEDPTAVDNTQRSAPKRLDCSCTFQKVNTLAEPSSGFHVDHIKSGQTEANPEDQAALLEENNRLQPQGAAVQRSRSHWGEGGGLRRSLRRRKGVAGRFLDRYTEEKRQRGGDTEFAEIGEGRGVHRRIYNDEEEEGEENEDRSGEDAGRERRRRRRRQQQGGHYRSARATFYDEDEGVPEESLLERDLRDAGGFFGGGGHQETGRVRDSRDAGGFGGGGRQETGRDPYDHDDETWQEGEFRHYHDDDGDDYGARH